MKYTVKTFVWTFLYITLFLGQAYASLCTDSSKVHKLEATTSGEVIEGPACVQVEFNALRYSGQLVKTITFTPGPNLAGVFPEKGNEGGGGPPAPGISTKNDFVDIQKQVADIEKSAQDRRDKNRRFASKVDGYLLKLKGTIQQSDEILLSGGVPAVLQLVQSSSAKSELSTAIQAGDSWVNSDDIISRIHALQQRINGLAFLHAKPTPAVAGGDACDTAAWKDWLANCGGQADLKDAQDRLAAVEKDVLDMASDSDKAREIAKRRGLLSYWQNLITSLKAESFVTQTEVPCGVLFNKNKQTAVALVLADRVSLFDFQTPQPQTKNSLVTVECASPFSVSAGVAFSTIVDRELSLVHSAPTGGGTTSELRFGESTRSRVHPMPMGMVHARFHEWADHRYAAHASFGVAANIKGDNAGGSNAEYLAGLSFSFFRTFYLTGGLHIGQSAELAGGFKVGDLVPSDVTEPPIRKSYKAGFGFAITFTKP